ncbi:MAG: aminotransferase class V-fold PLP-dependent enzyme [Pirellulales bacterium]|nr:aminotransferase class V-fold PLP-dependent enzyme [Pirellulales bacterium]
MREQMPVVANASYLDHAAVAPLSGPAADRVIRWNQEAAEQGDLVWPKWAAEVEGIRQTAASMINADLDEIAFVGNTTMGIHFVAEGFPWADGDNVVTFSNEFPTNAYPWMNLASRGVETRLVSVDGPVPDINRLFDKCDERTRLISISWVSFSSGWRLDLKPTIEEAHRRGILVMVDAIQGLGVFPFDTRDLDVDFVAADGHKWMLGPEGAGLFYLKKEHLSTLRPLGVGWSSVARSFDFDTLDWTPRNEARRYEGGSVNMVGILALGASLEFLTSLGTGPDGSAVGDRVIQVTETACDRLINAGAELFTDRTPGHESGIVSFDVPGSDLKAIRRDATTRNIALSHRGGRLRISPHAYNNSSDFDGLIEIIESRSLGS